MANDEPQLPLRDKLNLETARIRWTELQRFFAGGHVLHIAAKLDLLAVAECLAEDNAAKVRLWMETGQLAKVSDAQARDWLDGNAELWAVVIRPWVLVQPEQEAAQ